MYLLPALHSCIKLASDFTIASNKCSSMFNTLQNLDTYESGSNLQPKCTAPFHYVRFCSLFILLIFENNIKICCFFIACELKVDEYRKLHRKHFCWCWKFEWIDPNFGQRLQMNRKLFTGNVIVIRFSFAWRCFLTEIAFLSYCDMVILYQTVFLSENWQEFCALHAHFTDLKWIQKWNYFMNLLWIEERLKCWK